MQVKNTIFGQHVIGMTDDGQDEILSRMARYLAVYIGVSTLVTLAWVLWRSDVFVCAFATVFVWLHVLVFLVRRILRLTGKQRASLRQLDGFKIPSGVIFFAGFACVVWALVTHSQSTMLAIGGAMALQGFVVNTAILLAQFGR